MKTKIILLSLFITTNVFSQSNTTLNENNEYKLPLTIFLQTLTCTGLTAIGGITGVYLGSYFRQNVNVDMSSWTCSLIGAGVCITLGTALGATIIGSLFEYKSSFLFSLIGAGLGVGLTAGGIALNFSIDTIGIMMWILPTLGAILGYDLFIENNNKSIIQMEKNKLSINMPSIEMKNNINMVRIVCIKY